MGHNARGATSWGAVHEDVTDHPSACNAPALVEVDQEFDVVLTVFNRTTVPVTVDWLLLGNGETVADGTFTIDAATFFGTIPGVGQVVVPVIEDEPGEVDFVFEYEANGFVADCATDPVVVFDPDAEPPEVPPRVRPEALAAGVVGGALALAWLVRRS